MCISKISGDLVLNSLIQRKEIIAITLEITKAAWERVCTRPDINSNSNEPTIAGALRLEMVRERNSRNLFLLGIRGESSVYSNNNLLPEGYIDLQVTFAAHEESYFGLECKRVSGANNVLARKYVNEGIIDRFVKGKYCHKHEYGSILGFVIDNNVRNAANHIKEYLNKGTKQRESKLRANWEKETGFGAFQNLFRTKHQQIPHGSPITILHFLLPLN